MDLQVIYDLARENSNMSDIDRLVNIYHLLSQQLVFGVPGDVAEVGCNQGLTSIFLRQLIDAYAPDRELHVYDSFRGLPPPGPEDAYLKAGECSATVAELENHFSSRGLRMPMVHAGWFSDTLATELPERLCFAYLDGDFYESIKVGLEQVYPRMSPGGVVLVDDYCDLARNPRAWDGLPGVRRACDEFLRSREEQLTVLVGSGDLTMAFFRKR